MARSDRTTELLAELKAGVEGLKDSDRWERWLQTAARFHRYSFGNQVLIAWQRPEASRVAGFHRWLELGRHVRKGEKGIAILAPMVGRRKERDGEATDGETETETRVYGFRTVFVFDVAQTEGDPLPEICEALTGDGPAGMWDRLAALAGSIGWRVSVEPVAGAANGWARYSDRLIVVEAGNAPAMRLKTLVHEVAHALLHDPEADGRPGSREVVELEAESVAYVVSRSVGLDSSGYSFGYLAGWRADGAAIDRSGRRIAGAAKRILEAVGGAEHGSSAPAAPQELAA
jgi:hypothetical protein